MPDQPPAQPGEINHASVDRYTIGHLSAGVLLGLGRAPFWLALAGAIGWEIAEHPLKNKWPKAFPASPHDTIGNAAADAAAVMLGWWLFDYWNRKKPLVIFDPP